MSGPDMLEGEHEVTRGEACRGKETLPVERVRMSKDVEQSEETVTEKVRKERIEADADSDAHLRPQGR
jgi:stress response protein YsnF